MPTSNKRHSALPIDTMFLDRWSPRAFTGKPMEEADLMTILEAARWAPSSYNSQPWRFVYARRETPAWNKLLHLLTPNNQSWAGRAAALVVLVSNPMMRPPGAENDLPAYTHTLDTGTASGFMALQANKLGLYVHGMVGLDLERAFLELGLPEGYRVEAAYAIGYKGDPAELPEPLRAREAPSSRRPLAELAFEGGFPSPT